MKILCDGCGKDAAAVFCCADEAALCDACDRRVHLANKLAGQHRRFSLSARTHPACDICQERLGLLFCQEDRAIFCRDCDASVHSANHLTMKHNRFILTGVRLSSAPISSSPVTEAASKANTDAPVPASNQDKALLADNSSPISSTSSAAAAAAAATSSISEYLIKMCPGWRVEDLLVDDAAAAMEGFSKGDELLPFWEVDLDSGGLEPVAEEFPVWAPHVPHFSSTGNPVAAGDGAACYQPWNAGKQVGLGYQHGATARRERWSEDAFMVPHISPASTLRKRQRHSLSYY